MTRLFFIAMFISSNALAIDEIAPTVTRACLMSSDILICAKMSNINNNVLKFIDNNAVLKATAAVAGIAARREFVVNTGSVGFLHNNNSVLYFREEELMIEIVWGF
jgi:hypothetical protein